MMQRKAAVELHQNPLRRTRSRRLRSLAIAATVFAVVVFAMGGITHAQTAPTVYLRIVTSHGPVVGTATDPAHHGWIPCREAGIPSVSEITATNQAEVTSTQAAGKASRGVAAGGAAESRDAATGQAVGKRQWKPITITKEVDKSSPMLRELATSGERLSEVDIETYRPHGGSMVPEGSYKLTDAMITSIRAASSGGDRPSESITFTFQKIEVDYKK